MKFTNVLSRKLGKNYHENNTIENLNMPYEFKTVRPGPENDDKYPSIEWVFILYLNIHVSENFCMINHLLTLSWQAYKNDDCGRQGPFNAPSLKSVKIKLQRCARSQNRGSWVCPTILDYSQMATMCISCVYTCPSWYQENWSQEIFTKILIVEGPAVV